MDDKSLNDFANSLGSLLQQKKQNQSETENINTNSTEITNEVPIVDAATADNQSNSEMGKISIDNEVSALNETEQVQGTEPDSALIDELVNLINESATDNEEFNSDSELNNNENSLENANVTETTISESINNFGQSEIINEEHNQVDSQNNNQLGAVNTQTNVEDGAYVVNRETVANDEFNIPKINGGANLSSENEFNIPKINTQSSSTSVVVEEKQEIGKIEPEKIVMPVQNNNSGDFSIPELNNDGQNAVVIENPVDEKGQPLIKEKQGKQKFIMSEDAKANKKVAWLSYIFFFIPLLFKKDSEFVRFHANEGLEINIIDSVGILLTVLGKVITPSNANFGFFLSCVFFAGIITLGLTIFSRLFMIPIALSGRAKQTPWFWKARIIKPKKK